jgi:zinc transport system substrate-binding protein
VRYGPTFLRGIVIALSLALAGIGCSIDAPGTQVVAAFYPLAWLSQGIAGPAVSVQDLTPPGGEAHDAMLTAGQRADVETADVVVYLGDLGFQPEIEQAVGDARGVVVDLSAGGDFLVGSDGLIYDPHVWLDPMIMAGSAALIGDGLAEADPGNAAGYAGREASVIDELTALDRAYREGLSDCRYDTFVVSHEAFGYVATAYGLHQIGIQGLVPEGEPTAAAIQDARDAIASGEAAPAVFYENTDEGRRVGDSVAADAGVAALSLGTLETQPPTGDYLSVMRDNLTQLRDGLQCR